MLIRWGDEVFALRGNCPHQARSLVDGGQVQAGLVSRQAIGEVSLDTAAPTISCPWHTWKFNLRTGACQVDPKLRIKTYAVKVEDGHVFVELSEPSRQQPRTIPEHSGR
jgi:3-phenylpropionate/trans-cinnamate dioxygenase ferredoxin subunit